MIPNHRRDTQWEQKLHQFIDQALKETPANRIRWIHKHGADDEALKAEALSFLGDIENADDFLENMEVVRQVAFTKTPKAFGPFTLLEALGEGGMGIVYKAEQSRPVKRTVALKIMRGLGFSLPLQERFLKEQQIMAMLNHPGIATVFQFGSSDNGSPYFVMEYIEGQDIREYCRSHDLTAETMLNLVVQLCDALHYAHEKGVVHRDLKPSNILVTGEENPKVKIIDFGIAATPFAQSAETKLTKTGMLVGTPAYMSPEQVEAGKVDHRSDVYAVGALLYELLAGVPPLDFGTDPSFRKIRRITLEETPKPLKQRISRSLFKSRAPALDAIVEKALRKEPELRYQNAAAMASDLRRVIDHQSVHIKGPGLGYGIRKFLRRRFPLVIGISALTALALSAYMVESGIEKEQAAKRNLTAAGAFSIEAENIASDLHQAYFLPLHDIRAARQSAEDRTRQLTWQISHELPETYGAAHFLVGRTYFELGRLETAVKHLIKAREHGACEYYTGFHLGLCYAELYEIHLAQSRYLPEVLRLRSASEAEASYLIPAREHLTIVKPEYHNDGNYLKALIAHLNGNSKVALALLQNNPDTVYNFKSDLLAARIYITQARDLRAAGDLAGAEQALERATGHAAKLRESARSLPQAWELSAVLLTERITHSDKNADESVAAWNASAIIFLQNAETVEPGRIETTLIRNNVFLTRAIYEQQQGRSPIPFLVQIRAAGLGQGGSELTTTEYQKLLAEDIRDSWLTQQNHQVSLSLKTK